MSSDPHTCSCTGTCTSTHQKHTKKDHSTSTLEKGAFCLKVYQNWSHIVPISKISWGEYPQTPLACVSLQNMLTPLPLPPHTDCGKSQFALPSHIVCMQPWFTHVNLGNIHVPTYFGIMTRSSLFPVWSEWLSLAFKYLLFVDLGGSGSSRYPHWLQGRQWPSGCVWDWNKDCKAGRCQAGEGAWNFGTHWWRYVKH